MPDSEKERIKLEVDQYKYLIERNINNDEADLNAFNFLRILFEILGAIFLAVEVVIFTGDMVSGEYTPPIMKFLITQPVFRAKVLLSKYISIVLTSVIVILGIELMAYVSMGVMFGLGNTSYPRFVGTRYEYDLTEVISDDHSMKVIAGWTYMISRASLIVRVFVIQELFVIATASFAFFLSTVLKSSTLLIHNIWKSAYINAGAATPELAESKSNN